MSTRHDSITLHSDHESLRKMPFKLPCFCFESCLTRNCFLKGFVNGFTITRNEQIPLISLICPKAGLCRLSVSTETQSLQREDGRTACNVPRCNNFWCCAPSLFCLVSPALQALSYLVNVNGFMLSSFSCFQCSTFSDMFSFCSFTIILWRTPFPCDTLRSLKPFVSLSVKCSRSKLFICRSSETRPMRSRWTLLFRPGG